MEEGKGLVVDRDKDTVLKDLQTVNAETMQLSDTGDKELGGEACGKQCFGLYWAVNW